MAVNSPREMILQSHIEAWGKYEFTCPQFPVVYRVLRMIGDITCRSQMERLAEVVARRGWCFGREVPPVMFSKVGCLQLHLPSLAPCLPWVSLLPQEQILAIPAKFQGFAAEFVTDSSSFSHSLWAPRAPRPHSPTCCLPLPPHDSTICSLSSKTTNLVGDCTKAQNVIREANHFSDQQSSCDKIESCSHSQWYIVARHTPPPTSLIERQNSTSEDIENIQTPHSPSSDDEGDYQPR